jgi:ribosome-binding factor A
MSPDLKLAKVYVSIFGNDIQKKKNFAKLQSQKASLRSLLGHSVKLRYTPDLIFYLDESLDQAMKLENIFNKIHQQDRKEEEQGSTPDV